ncbi:MAG: T9SS type A sorting domain-containing protein [Crocinitomicaceae bacterium]|nr:T9SS type A sorting domain-containing protein [Crocinitomicaceae bacterium]
MRKLILGFAFFILAISVFAADGDTTVIRTHDAVDMTWNQQYKQKALFPDGTKTYRKILFKYTLGCATGGCSDWDYLTMAYINKKINDSTYERIHLASLVTPYANGYSSAWNQEFVLDITNYATELVGQSDSVEIGVWYDGWSAGFSATFDFEFIEGTPPRTPMRTIPIYYGGFNYGDPTNSIENSLTQDTVNFLAGEDNAVLHFTATGHSFGSDPCAEFCPKDYFLKVNGSQVAQNTLWNDCGMNANIAQPGTWVYDRAGWCPGTLATRWEHDVTPSIIVNTDNYFDIDMEAYTYNGGNNFHPNYKIGTVLHTLSAPNFQVDAEVLDILSPTTKFENSRFNPTCGNGEIIIKNNGETTLTSATITYWVEGGTVKTYSWTGSLDFEETELVVLPMNGMSDYSQASGTVKRFYAKIENPNGQTDEWVHDNQLTSLYETPLVLESTFVVWLKTNASGNQSSYKVTDIDGNVVFSKGGLANNTLYKDTLNLAQGCYKIELLDTGGDGLNFFANNDGSGLFQVRKIPAGMYKSFNTNFGDEITEYFTVDYELNTSEVFLDKTIRMFPNPTNGSFEISTDLDYDNVKLIDLSGRVVLETTDVHIQTSSLENGSYLVLMEDQGKLVGKSKLVVQH